MTEIEVQVLEGKLPAERTAAQTMQEFMRHCAARDPQPLRVMKGVMDLWYQLLARYQEEVKKFKAFPLRRASALEKEIRVGIFPGIEGLEICLCLEVVTAQEKEIETPGDQKAILIIARSTVSLDE